MRIPALVMVGVLVCALVPAKAAVPKTEAEMESAKYISVSSMGKVKVKPDACVLLLEVRSTSPLASDALQQNNKKLAEVTAKMKEMGIKEEDTKWSGNQFTPAGGGRYYMPAGQRPTGFDVYNTLQVRMRDVSPANPDELFKKVATTLDELGKIGVSVMSFDISRISLGGASTVIFTLQHPEEYEKQANEMAIEKAKPVAEDLAKKMGVKVTGVHSVQSSFPRLPERPYGGGTELDFIYFSSSPDELTVKANMVVNFSFK